MSSLNLFRKTLLAAAMLASGLAVQAQTTATWIGPATGGEWNTAANWDTGAPPLDSTTNAMIGVATNVNYNTPMLAASFGTLGVKGILNVNTAGFNSGAVTMTNNAGRLFVNNGGVMNVTGGIGLFSNSIVILATGSAMSLSGNLTFGGSVAATAFGIFTNNGGTLTVPGVSMNPNNASVNTGSRLVITGGTNNLGAYSAQRSPGGNSAPPALGTDGLVVSNGFVNTTSLSVGNNAHGIIYLVGGTFTNAGTFTIKNSTTTRPARFLQTGGLFVDPDPNQVIMNPSGTTGDTVYSVLGGTNIVGGFQFGSGANVGVIFFTNAATILVGSGGIVTNGGTTITAMLNTGGKFGASTDWTNAAPIVMNGGAFDAQDAAGTPHNIYSSGLMRGAGNLVKTGAGTLTLTATNNYTGATTISAGTLALATDVSGSVGSIATSSPITVGSNAVFDVSQVGGVVLGSAKTIAGVGTVIGTFAVGPASNVSPAGSGAQGTLKFANGLAATNANFRMELTDDPTGTVKTNDFVSITGDFTVDSTNNVIVTPVTTLGLGTYRLIKFTGAFNGNITNLACSSGTLTNPPGSGEIDLIVAPARGPATLVWRGDGTANVWDTASSSNWLNGVVLDRFYPGDTNTFDDSATNFVVNLSGILSPASSSVVTIKATNDYTLTGSGDISGATGLTKTNSGKLTIMAISDYTGITTIAGGVLSVSNLANGGSSSPIGAAGTSSANIVFNGGTLEYLGANKTIDRGATILNGGSILNVSNAGVTLTIAGGITGAGALTKVGNGQLTLTAANDYNGGTVINAGNIRANPATTLGTNSLTLSGGNGAATPAAFVFAGDAQTLSVNLNVVGTNNFITMGGNDTVNGITGSGTLNVEAVGALLLTFGASDLSTFTGTIYWDTVTTNRLFPNSGTSINASTVMFDLGLASGVLMNRDGGSYRLGAVRSSSSSTQIRGSNNSGSANTTYFIGEKGVDATFAGVIRNGTGGTGARVNIVKLGADTFTLTGANTYNGFTTVSNGVLALGDGVTDGSIDSTTNINVIAGAVLDVSGRSDHTLSLGGSQILRGSGTVRGILETSSGGTVSPGGGSGGAIGTLTVTNNINLGGTSWMKLSRGSSPNSDRLVSSTAGVINYNNGTLVVTNIGAALQIGDTFTLFGGATLNSSTFGTIILPNYYNWDTTQLTVNGQVSVTAVLPLPSLNNVDFSNLQSGSITLNAINGAPGGAVTVLTSTDLTLPLSSWTTVTTTTFDGSGNLNLPITVDPASPQSFFILKVN